MEKGVGQDKGEHPMTVARTWWLAMGLVAGTLGACGRESAVPEEPQRQEEGHEPVEQTPGAPPAADRPPMPPAPSTPVRVPPQTFLLEYAESVEFNRLLDALIAAGIHTIRSRRMGMNRLSVHASEHEAAWKVIREDPFLWSRFAEYAPPPR